MLGNISSIFSAGEINNYLKSGWINNYYCSCGELASDCSFWPNVKASLEKSIQPDPMEILDLSDRLENWRYFLKRPFQKTNASDDAQEKYVNFNSALISSIAELQGSEWVVDASKNPVRLHHLLESDELDCSAIHIIRDPRGVCWSMMKPSPKNLQAGIQKDLPSIPYIVTIKTLYLNAFFAEKVKRKMPTKHISIKYDDLLNATNSTLEKIGALMKTDTSGLQRLVASNESFQQDHNIAGNRLRMKSNIKLRYDQSWKNELSGFQYFAITLLTLPLLLKYNFPLNRRISHENERVASRLH